MWINKSSKTHLESPSNAHSHLTLSLFTYRKEVFIREVVIEHTGLRPRIVLRIL